MGCHSLLGGTQNATHLGQNPLVSTGVCLCATLQSHVGHRRSPEMRSGTSTAAPCGRATPGNGPSAAEQGPQPLQGQRGDVPGKLAGPGRRSRVPDVEQRTGPITGEISPRGTAPGWDGGRGSVLRLL